ncbi:MAG: VanZ family protein [Lachnospiraceae bacterium]|nr:VanZ family protein [Lachnospiraceae bacterium]
MIFDPTSLFTNLFVTAACLIMVFAMPLIDRYICDSLGINIWGGLSRNPNADKLLKLRKVILFLIFGLYFAVFLYLVYFSRSPYDGYEVRTVLFEYLQGAVRVINVGFLNVISAIYKGGLSAAYAYFNPMELAEFAKFYMNIMLFVPMGYLLPYIIRWFRIRVRTRPAVACFLISLTVENIQLITRRGFYDVDDLFANTLGGIAGAALYVLSAYVLTHPNWRKELRAYRRWKKRAKKRTLYPFARKMILYRTTILASKEEAIYDFYVGTLGFWIKRQIVPLDSENTSFLLEMGSFQLEVICLNREINLDRQYLTISAKSLPQIKRRLKENNIETDSFKQDPYTGLRALEFEGPDRVLITILEK